MKTLSAIWRVSKKYWLAFCKDVRNDRNFWDLRWMRAKDSNEEELARRKRQRECSHRRFDLTSACVYVQPSWPGPGSIGMPGFLICQHCQAIIRPEADRPTHPARLQDCQAHIFDTPLFNQHYSVATWGGEWNRQETPRSPEEQKLYEMPLAELRKLAEAR